MQNEINTRGVVAANVDYNIQRWTKKKHPSL